MIQNNNRAGDIDINELNSTYDNNITQFNNNCEYININKLNTNNQISIANLNIRSIAKNGAKLNYIIDTTVKPDFIILSEIWQNQNYHHTEGYLPLKSRTRTNKKGGGVGILIKDCHEAETLNNLSKVTDDIEYVSIVTKNKQEESDNNLCVQTTKTQLHQNKKLL